MRVWSKEFGQVSTNVVYCMRVGTHRARRYYAGGSSGGGSPRRPRPLSSSLLPVHQEIAVAALKIADLTLTLEHEQVISHFVHEELIVRDHHKAPVEGVSEVVLEGRQSCEIEVVGRLVKYEYIGFLGQYLQQL